MKFRVDQEIAATGRDFPLGVGTVHHLGRDVGVYETEYYRLDICHVEFRYGDVVRGFMPRVVFKLDPLSAGNGDMHRGENQDAWDAAKDEGKAAADRLQVNLDQQWAGSGLSKGAK
jgi:hypothetical protein